MELEHVRHLEEVVSGCTQEKDVALEALRREMEAVERRHEAELGAVKERHEAETKSKVEEVRGQMVKEHMAKFRYVLTHDTVVRYGKTVLM